MSRNIQTNILMPTSLREDLKLLATLKGKDSMATLVRETLEELVKNEQELLNKVKEVRNGEGV